MQEEQVSLLSATVYPALLLPHGADGASGVRQRIRRGQRPVYPAGIQDIQRRLLQGKLNHLVLRVCLERAPRDLDEP